MNASADADLDAAFATFVQRRIDGLVVGSDPMFVYRADRVAALAARSAIPSIYDFRTTVSAGGLMSYGTNINDAYHQMGIYTGRILKGTKPAGSHKRPPSFRPLTEAEAEALLGGELLASLSGVRRMRSS